jgi:hypothetical protein
VQEHYAIDTRYYKSGLAHVVRGHIDVCKGSIVRVNDRCYTVHDAVNNAGFHSAPRTMIYCKKEGYLEF